VLGLVVTLVVTHSAIPHSHAFTTPWNSAWDNPAKKTHLLDLLTYCVQHDLGEGHLEYILIQNIAFDDLKAFQIPTPPFFFFGNTDFSLLNVVEKEREASAYPYQWVVRDLKKQHRLPERSPPG